MDDLIGRQVVWAATPMNGIYICLPDIGEIGIIEAYLDDCYVINWTKFGLSWHTKKSVGIYFNLYGTVIDILQLLEDD